MASKASNRKVSGRRKLKLPVIQLSLQHLVEYCERKVQEKQILETLPYLGLDIEDQAGDIVSVEYSPNRPDFSSEAGIARSLVGQLGIVTGLPIYKFKRSQFQLSIADDRIRTVRPFIQAIYAEISVTDELIKQLITMQEDLHNGIGRKRTKVAIGIHNADPITKKIRYHAVEEDSFSFVPLGRAEKLSIKQILSDTDQGLSYRKLVSKGPYPMLEDSSGNVLSMPPIINGDLTRLKPGISRLFVDLTGTDERVVDSSTAIVASMLSDVGADVQTVEVSHESGRRSIWAPDMSPKEMKFDLRISNDILGFDFTEEEARDALAKSRIELTQSLLALIPRFRHDIIHPIDLAEEVILGFGVARVTPQSVSTSLAGALNPRISKIDLIAEALVGLGLTEIWNLSLTSRELVPEDSLSVDDPKSLSFQYLRPNLISSLLSVLGASTHEEYPQKIFEIAPVFARSEDCSSRVSEEDHVSVAIANSDASYTTIRSIADAFLTLVHGRGVIEFHPANTRSLPYAQGRTALIRLTTTAPSETKIDLGFAGEISPEALERYGISVPVVALELNLEPFLKE